MNNNYELRSSISWISLQAEFSFSFRTAFAVSVAISTTEIGVIRVHRHRLVYGDIRLGFHRNGRGGRARDRKIVSRQIDRRVLKSFPDSFDSQSSRVFGIDRKNILMTLFVRLVRSVDKILGRVRNISPEDLQKQMTEIFRYELPFLFLSSSKDRIEYSSDL